MAVIEGTAGNETLTGTSDADEIYGYDGHDFLYGGNGDDLLVGGYGNDSLNGQVGADLMVGGYGNDTYYVDDSNDVIVEAADGDQDFAYVSASYFDMGTAYIEQTYYSETTGGTILGSAGNNEIYSSTGNDWLEGKDGNDYLDGGAGDDHLDGGSGNDLLDGWLGNDTMIGGAGDDTYNVESSLDVVTEYANEGTDTVRVRKSSYTLPANVENADLHYYSGSISVSGNSADNVFIMGSGAQSVSGGSGSDTVAYTFTAAVTIDLSIFELGGAAADDSLSSIENLTGSAYDDVLRGNGGGNVIDGGAGADTMVGRAGSDIYYVDNVGDVVTELAGGGTGDEVRIRNLASYALPDYVEKLTNITNYMLTGTGNGLANEMNGGTSVDVFYGGAGADTLNGNDGDDLLYGEGDHDVLNGGAGSDTMAGGLGNDTYLVADAGDSVTEQMNEGIDQVQTTLLAYSLTAYVENLTFTGVGNFTGTGNSLGNIIIGQWGNDTLNGSGGADELRGAAGNDTLNGGDGDDLLIGGGDADVLTSGSGGDMFRFVSGETGTDEYADRITDFEHFYDKIDLRGVDADVLTDGDQAFTFIGTSAFSGAAGELRYWYDGTDTWLQGDNDGDGDVDLEIVFSGNTPLVTGDFYL
ncbi:MAG: hypothetical protein QOG72_608 [Sphingomonadales bacterium]|jgi:Ca2+-binding RTX toxin-like protein|nr:hypothetical protein [Sphingomonadales bacterium]